MENVNKSNTLENTNALFDDYFNLNKDIEKLYEMIGNKELQDEFEKNVRLTKLRNENHKRYYEIDIFKYKDLPFDFDDITDKIIGLYNSIDSKKILEESSFDSSNTEILLDDIFRRIKRLDKMVNSYLKQITESNDEKQSKFSVIYFKNLEIEDNLKNELIEKYNDLVVYSSYITKDIYEDLKRQVKREEYINGILRSLNIGEEKSINFQNKNKLDILNQKINIEIAKYKNQIQYLEDIIPENSKYISDFEKFKDFCNRIIAYDDTSYENTKQTYEILSDEIKFKSYISNFEELFIQERIDKQKEEKFIYEKIGIKNLKNSLYYITANYMDKLDDESKKIIEYIINKLNTENYNLDEFSLAVSLIVKSIWENTITNIYNFNPNEDYYFICSNNQFIDEKYQTILITKKELNRAQDYSDYQIGFICGYNDNIMYITENDDIMSVNYSEDMSNLKTPIQLEQEFLNFGVCNRIALNGYKTKIEAVYYINDGNMDKYLKAIELANIYKLPLIELKKDNY